MPNDYFTFNGFTVRQDRCAMKVGTDGVLLGAWARSPGRRILDIGTGTGLIALMMAQRYTGAHITAIDIEPGACAQARENAVAAGMADRISVANCRLQDFDGGGACFDTIVCNPPFYSGTPRSKSPERTLARSASSLPAGELFDHAAHLLTDDGQMSLIVPAACFGTFDAEAAMAGLWPHRVCALRTVARKPVSRYLLAYGKQRTDGVERSEECIMGTDGGRSAWYAALTEDFYLG